jgi:putative ABC transport system permease protein
VGLVTRQAAAVTIIGLTIGLAPAGMLARLLSGLLFGVTSDDPATSAAIALFLLSAAVAACVLPAYRAARVDPVVALRG